MMHRTAALRRIFPDHERRTRAILSQFPGNGQDISEPLSGRGYLLCITPRSGSTMLSDVLGRTESVGFAREHFRPADGTIPEWMTTYASLKAVLRRLESKAPSGCFGVKGDLFQMFPLISESLFAGADGISKHIYLTRRDRVGQAISLARAAKTNEWHSHDAPAADPDLTVEDVLSSLRYVRAMEADWETVFTALQVTPLRLYYEDLVAAPAVVFERIRQYLGVQWKIDPAGIVSAYQSVSERHDPRWIQSIRAQFEAPSVPVSNTSTCCP